jgi:hypothetical protein
VKTVGKQLSDAQMRFRPNRSTIDNIFIIRQVFEKCHEFNIELYNILIDYSRAFDSVYRNKIIECLLEYEVPTKLIRLISGTLIDTKAKIKVNNSLSNDFKVEFGVRQGDPLSATLFSVAIDSILKQSDIRCNISARLKQCIAYANDIVITAQTKEAAFDTSEKLKNQSLKTGLVIIENKTKYLRCTRGNYQMNDLYTNNMGLKQIHSYKYLGPIINRDKCTDEEIRERITSGNKAYYANRSILKSKLVCKKFKLKIYWTIIRPVIMYGCETWVLKEAIKQKLLVFERKILRGIFGPTTELNGMWRIKTDSELNKLIKNQTIINF